MDTKKFELTLGMANLVGQLETDFIYWREVDRNQERSDMKARVRYVVSKVLSLLEPVELAQVEDASWQPEKVWDFGKNRGRGHISQSRKLLESIEVGEVKRLIHNDIYCHKRNRRGGYNCGISKARDVLRRKGYYFRIYHEKEHSCVISRVSEDEYHPEEPG